MKWNQLFKKPRLRKSTLGVLSIFAVIVFGIVFAQSTKANSKDEGPCSVATLNGSYGHINSGFDINDPTVFFPIAAIARYTYDGAGNFTGTVYGHSPDGNTTLSVHGTYKVKTDCTGTIFFPFSDTSALRVKLVIVRGGEEYFSQTTAKGRIINGIGKRQ